MRTSLSGSFDKNIPVTRCYTAADLYEHYAERGQRRFLDVGTRQCWLIWNKDYLGMPNCDFFAASAGWEDLTTTGYRSTFLWREWLGDFGAELDDAQALALLHIILDYSEVEFAANKPAQIGLFD